MINAVQAALQPAATSAHGTVQATAAGPHAARQTVIAAIQAPTQAA